MNHFFKQFQLLLFILPASLFPFLTQATTIPVNSLADSGPGTMRQAIEDAGMGDTILFAVQGQILLDSQIVIQKTLTLLGPGPELLSISGGGQTRIFKISQTDTLTVQGVTFRDGYTQGIGEEGGGAIRNAGRLLMKNCLFTLNIASNGGAIELESFGGGNSYLSLENCGFYYNKATLEASNIRLAGGAIYADGRLGGKAEIYAINSTFSHNEASLTGGAVYIVGDDSGGVKLTAVNCTFAQNKAHIRCGGIDNSEAEVLLLTNTILADNMGEASRPDWFGTIRSGGHNILGDDGGGTYSLIVAKPTDLINVDAGLGPLANNGGPFLTHSLKCNSPAINMGVDSIAPTLDQRGQTRVGTADIGAFERNESIDLQITHLGESNQGSFRQAYILACPGDTLYLDQISGILPFQSSLQMDKDINLIGNALNPLAFSGRNSIRILEIAPQTKVFASWLSFRDANPELYGGGAIQNKGELHLSHCTLWHNKAKSGGAIANYGDGGTARLFLVNCTLSNNEALYLDGGAIDNRSFTHAAVATLTYTTVAYNQAGNKGGGIYNQTGDSLTLINTLISDNYSGEGPDFWGEYVAEGNSLIQQAGQSSQAGGSGSAIFQDPLLDPLGSYGGPTLSHRLRTGSPAIDAADISIALPTDQRGEARVFGSAPDIGAYEYDPATGLFLPPNLQAAEFELFPNPGRNYIYLLWNGELSQQAEIHIYDMQGRHLKYQALRLEKDNKYELNLTHLPPGMYLLQLRLEQSQQSARLVIH